MSSTIWNPWHGCTKYSEGCANCYVYRRDSSVGRDASEIYRTRSFNLPIKKKRSGEFAIAASTRVFACMTSDFFLDSADVWRDEAWDMIRQRSDLPFTIITKRVLRIKDCLPSDWGDGWDNVCICATMENQARADERLGEFLALPLKHRRIICEPCLSKIDFRGKLDGRISGITAGGESGPNARICDFEWILYLREQCERAGIGFHFRQTGAKFLKDGHLYRIARKNQHSQARRTGINIDK